MILGRNNSERTTLVRYRILPVLFFFFRVVTNVRKPRQPREGIVTKN